MSRLWGLAIGAWLLSTSAGATGTGVLGHWLISTDMVIELASCGDAVCGRLVGLPDPAARDVHNPDQALAGRQLCRLNVLDVAEIADGWHGRYYNPANGTTYRVDLRLGDDGGMLVWGSDGTPLMTRLIPLMAVWSPVPSPDEPCAPAPVS